MTMSSSISLIMALLVREFSSFNTLLTSLYFVLDLIAFPSEYLYGEDLNKALEYMNENKKFSKLVFYLEACESGQPMILNRVKTNSTLSQ